MKQLFKPVINLLRGKDASLIGAAAGFVLALLLVIFGILKTIFIILLTIGGYILGVKFFSDTESFHRLLDRLFPPGRFR